MGTSAIDGDGEAKETNNATNNERELARLHIPGLLNTERPTFREIPNEELPD
jgi:hypothetical protein